MAGSLAKFAEAAIWTRLSKPASYAPHRVSNQATTSSTATACSTKARRQSHSWCTRVKVTVIEKRKVPARLPVKFG
jgi:hypothetical protein